MNARSPLAIRLRLGSGLVLMAYVTTHLANHALGVFGVAAMEWGRGPFLALWRHPLGTTALASALLIHLGLALAGLHARRSLRMPVWEALQILLGLAIPLFLTLHLLGTRIVHEVFGVTDSYAFVLLATWPEAWRQVLLVVLVWSHGCLGLHGWLRLRAWYAAAAPWMLAIALVLPTLALAGYVAGAREMVTLLARDPAVIAAMADAQAWPDPETVAWVHRREREILAILGVVLALILIARGLRRRREGRGRVVRITYPGARTVAVAPGTSVLEASRQNGIGHASVCGGRGRCSTCRVRIGAGGAELPEPSPAEQRVLDRLGTGPDVRLACQLRPSADIAVTPLLPASATPRAAHRSIRPGQGIEREVAVLFADLRAFTRLAESRLPYDVVFVLNQYFAAVGRAVEAAGGRIDKFVGDGVMVLFGIETTPETAARQALAAARAIALAVDELNRSLADDLPEPLRIAIGLHAGPVILGDLGYGATTSLTAVGDTVNVASRLEAIAKQHDSELAFSDEVATRAGLSLDTAVATRLEIAVRGRRRVLAVLLLTRAASLPTPTMEPPTTAIHARV